MFDNVHQDLSQIAWRLGKENEGDKDEATL